MLSTTVRRRVSGVTEGYRRLREVVDRDTEEIAVGNEQRGIEGGTITVDQRSD